MDIYTIDKPEQLRILKVKSAPVENIDGKTAELAESMISTMISGNGIGLAAPQVGIPQRIFTVQIEDGDPIVFINPEITATSSELSVYEEGCLSVPAQYAKVKRPAEIEIQAWNTRGRPFSIQAAGLLATVIQHELDHLNGVLFIDHINERKRAKILKKFGMEPEDYNAG